MMGKLGQRTSICITTLNRPEFVVRTLRFYRDTGFGGVLLFGDGSTGEAARATRAAVKTFERDLRIDYLGAPELSQPATMTALSKRVSTEFAVFSGDDDYLIPYALSLCESALDRNPDHVSAHGRAVALNAKGARAIPFSTSRYELPTPYYRSSLMRFEALLEAYAVGIFCLHRADVWREMFRDSHLMQDVPIGAELAPCFMSATLGRGLALDCLYLVRQIHGARYDRTPGQDWILGDTFAPSSRLMMYQLTEEIRRRDCDNPELPEREDYELVPMRVWNAYMRYLSYGYFDMPEYATWTSPEPNLRLEKLASGTRREAVLFRPVLRNLTEKSTGDSTKPTLLINWGNPYVLDETITPILPELAERFAVVLLLVDYNLSDTVRAKTEGWKQAGLVDDVLIAPIHGGTTDAHLFMGRLIPALRWYDFDVLLSISAMQPYERYLTDHILPDKCLRLVLWPHPTNLFIYPELAKAVVRDGRRSRIRRAIAVRRLKLQPRVTQELLRPSLTSLRLALFIGLGLVLSKLRRRDATSDLATRTGDVAARLDAASVASAVVGEHGGGQSGLDRLLMRAKSYYDARKERLPDRLRGRVAAWHRWIRRTQDAWRKRRHRLRLFVRRIKALVFMEEGEQEFLLRRETGMGVLAWVLIGMNLRRTIKDYYHTCDRYVLPLLQMGQAIPFRRLDSITQIGTDQFDACLFYNDNDTEAHKVLYDTPNFYTVRYVARPPAKVGEPVNAVLLPFTLHAEHQMTPQLIDFYRRDLGIALKESGAEEVHIRPHPGRDEPWLQDLADNIAAGGVPCRLVDAKNPLSDEAARYCGVVGAVSGSLRDARLGCPDIFVVGSVALSETQFDMPKEVVGFPESIGWIERDGAYDPAIFQPRGQAMAAFPTVPELIERLRAGDWNRRPARL